MPVETETQETNTTIQKPETTTEKEEDYKFEYVDNIVAEPVDIPWITREQLDWNISVRSDTSYNDLLLMWA